MNRLFTIMDRFAPEAIEIMELRYQVLRQVIHNSPIGRRQLAKNIGCTERLVRSEVDLLKDRGALKTSAAGIFITPYGEEMLNDIDELIPFLFNIEALAKQIKARYALKEVIIVPGDSYQDSLAKKDIGRAAARFLEKLLYPGCIMAVSGGSTLAEMAEAITDGIYMPEVLVVPARGGLGEDMDQQASTIAARIARAIGAQYRLLHIPDSLEKSTAQALKEDMHINAVVQIIKASNILVQGIGSALEMASRRRLSAEQIGELQKRQAVGEVLRYYFDKMGNIVYETPGIGMELEDLDNIDTIVAVAGGSNKAQAIDAVLSKRRHHVLITDEGAAKQIINGKG
ncbi:MAG: sugar-binding transcriptional regulator [Syntrophomonadaceae bacterium]|jgi:central glycolytic genes regulator